MPRNKSYKVLQAIIFVSFVALFSNLGLNLWEKYTLQAELGQMRTSLHFLKEILTNIGTAYDKLHNDLKELAVVAQEKQSLLPKMHTELEKHKAPSKLYTLDRRKLHDMQVGAMVEARNAAHNYPPKADKVTEKHYEKAETRCKEVHTKKDFIKDTATMTRYPPKSTGVGVDSDRNSYIRFSNPAVCKHYKRNHFCHDPFDYHNNYYYGDGF